MRMLLTSGGVHNDLIRQALIDLLSKPIEDASIVAVIDAILPFPGDNTNTLADLQRLRDLGWKEYDLLSLFAGPVYFLDDDTALLVRDPASAPEIVSTGQWRHFDGSGRLLEQSPS